MHVFDFLYKLSFENSFCFLSILDCQTSFLVSKIENYFWKQKIRGKNNYQTYPKLLAFAFDSWSLKYSFYLSNANRVVLGWYQHHKANQDIVSVHCSAQKPGNVLNRLPGKSKCTVNLKDLGPQFRSGLSCTSTPRVCLYIYIYIYMKVNFSLNDKNIMFYFWWDKNINVKGHKKCLNYKN